MATPVDAPQPKTPDAEIEAALDKFKGLIQAATGPVHAKYPYVPDNDPAPAKGDLLHDLPYLGFSEIKTLVETFIDKTKGVQDDNTLILERLVAALSKLPADSKFGQDFTDMFINDLWVALPHPPITSLGEKYRYRDADGGNNNIDNPDLGRANTAYARSARPAAIQNIGLPDPGDIFDLIMARPADKFEPHPNKISSMLFYLASIIIHDLFRTDHNDFNNSLTSSYLDLAPLYGSWWDLQKAMRTSYDGKIKPDCFSEKRLLGFPPGVGATLIMFNRYHNYIVTNLALINENDRFTKPKSEKPTSVDQLWAQYDEGGHLKVPNRDASPEEKALYAWAKYDNDLFQTARLINCGLYANLILKDYVRTILNLNRTGSSWDLDPRAVETRTLFNTPAPQGVGNQVSAEFNLIYRWHSAISERDDKWTQAAYKKMFPDVKDPKDVTLDQLMTGLIKFEKMIPFDPEQREFANLKRNPDTHMYSDDDLVEILTTSIDDVAGSFGANKVPAILRSVEMLGIIQARKWRLASLNEFREFFGLTPHKTFEDITGDKEAAHKLRSLYDSPDSVELYPGLVAEKAKPPVKPGSGLCVNYTTSRAILSDAVGLVRGDRFYTVDYTPKNLTNWGFKEVSSDLTVNQGHVAYKLFYNAFPNHFTGNSVYAHFPFVISKENEVILKELGTAQLFDFNKPKRIPDIVVVDTYKAAVKVLDDKVTFKVTWGEAIAYMVKHPRANYGWDYCLAGDGPKNENSRKLVMHGLYPDKWRSEVKKFYEVMTAKFIKENSYRIGNKHQVDIVRDVAALVNTHFSAGLFNLPLKTEENPHSIYTEQQLYQVLSILFMAIFYDIDPSKSFLLRNAARELTAQLGDLCMLYVESISKGGIIAEIISKLHSPKTELTEYGIHMIHRLLEGGLSIEEVVWTNLVPTAASMVANQAQLFAQCLDYYLGDGSKYLCKIQEIAQHDTPEADEKMLRYFLEGGRMRATAGLFRDASVDAEVQDGDKTVKIPKGHRLLVNMVKASMDPTVFPDPHEVKLDRDIKSYIHYGRGPHQCAGLETSQVALTTMFKAVMKLKGLRRAPGQQGEIKKIPAPYGYTIYMQPDWSGFYPIPMTMKIQWDE